MYGEQRAVELTVRLLQVLLDEIGLPCNSPLLLLIAPEFDPDQEIVNLLNTIRLMFGVLTSLVREHPANQQILAEYKDFLLSHSGHDFGAVGALVV